MLVLKEGVVAMNEVTRGGAVSCVSGVSQSNAEFRVGDSQSMRRDI
jgi:hypothetical protein